MKINVLLLQLFLLVNYHTLSENLTKPQQFLNQILSQHQVIIPDVTSSSKPTFFRSLIDKPNNIIYTEKIAQYAYELISEKSQNSAEQFIPILFGQKWNKYNLNTLLPNDYITNKINVNINRIVGNIEYNIIRQYLSPILLAIEYLEKDEFFSDFQNIIEITKILNKLDLLSNDIISRNPVEQLEHTDQLIKLSSILAEKSNKFIKSEVLSIAINLYFSLSEINQLTLRNSDLYRQTIKTTIIETDLGKIALGGFDNDYYEDDYFIIIDLGGNDTYISNSQTLQNKMTSPVNLIIDFSGDDIYIGNNYCFGAGIFGISILMDFDGNDSYSTTDFSLGSALFGVGIFFDKNGNDIYSAQSFTIGSAFYGWGIFVDKSGNDIYRGVHFTQAASLGLAMGILIDAAGNDNYIASKPFSENKDKQPDFHNYAQGASLGLPYSISGGIGILLDLSGDDNYIANNSAQAYANYCGIAALIDKSGNERYQSGSCSQAYAIYNSFAYLFDYDGFDTYSSNYNSQSFSQDLSLSVLIDNYSINDYFITKDNKQNYNSFSYYLKITNTAEDKNLSEYAFNFFNNNPFMQEYAKMPNPFTDLYLIPSYFENYEFNYNETNDKNLDLADLFSLLVIYRNKSIKFNSILNEFLEKTGSFEYLEDKINTKTNSEILVLPAIISSYSPEYHDKIIQLINEMFTSSDFKKKLLAIQLSVVMELTDNIPKIYSLLNYNDYSLKIMALWALAQLNYKNSNVYYSLLENDKSYLRFYSAYAITKTDLTFFADEKILSDPELSYSAYKGLMDIENIDFETILSLIESNSNEKFKLLVITLVNKSNISNKNAKKYIKRFRNLPDNYRAEIYVQLLNAKNNAYNILSDRASDPIFKKLRKRNNK